MGYACIHFFVQNWTFLVNNWFRYWANVPCQACIIEVRVLQNARYLFKFSICTYGVGLCFLQWKGAATVAEYRQRFPQPRYINEKVFIRVYSKLCECERAAGQALQEIENILQLVGGATKN